MNLHLVLGNHIGMKWFKRRSERKRTPFNRIARLVFWGFFGWLVLRSCVIQIYRVPTDSMNNTFKEGDYIVVNKLVYGARVPMTPLSLPFGHTYLDWITFSYHRIPGFSSIRRNDILVFNYPAEKGLPVDHRREYVKRCIALAGDSIAIRKGIVFVNGKKFREAPGSLPIYSKKHIRTATDSLFYSPSYYPHSGSIKWNSDRFGPLLVPKTGMRIRLTHDQLILYKEVIESYEQKEVLEQDGTIYINGKIQQFYTFEMDYYFVLGDNRPNSVDSRFWGFVPEDHIIGKVVYSF
ncbi:MAG TPA: signal peptidase I [Fluviicola sp.]|nr:signal peptidase I [Fluviicola sp.]